MEPALGIAQMAAKLFPLLFNMMGPIGVIPLFAALTAGLDQPTRNAMALRASPVAGRTCRSRLHRCCGA